MGSTLMRGSFCRYLALPAPKNAPLANATVGPFALAPCGAVILVMTAAGGLPVERHSVFLERVEARRIAANIAKLPELL